ncbi:hypothetical protein Y032_0187g1118 [Ancylostoma ceylanicum]|uniref:Uncharacterized protein n=1 Tax=Ancylostoma ceylanicum TaxID=53326 RepID=A0A016SRS2_9BILA|nr:hypothetical protein Y032_0187g1118 [Ancylostoma ceylanicum]
MVEDLVKRGFKPDRFYSELPAWLLALPLLEPKQHLTSTNSEFQTVVGKVVIITSRVLHYSMALARPASVEVGRSPSTSSAGSVPPAEDKLRMVSIFGGDTICFEWKPEEPQKNAELVSILFEVIGCVEE